MKKATAMLIALLVFPALTVSAAMLEGTVQQIDKAKNQIVLNTAEGRETVAISSATKGADSVKAGDRVKVTYSKNGEKRVASAIADDKSSPAAAPRDRSEFSPKAGSKSPMGAR
jgi:transcription elongation GreA/GreB family factor